jgi:hypothetical protein
MRLLFANRCGEYDDDDLPGDAIGAWDVLDWVMGDGPDELVKDHLPEEPTNDTDRQ